MKDHVPAMKDAVDPDGVNLMGCCPQGHIDLVSAGKVEMKKRCGYISLGRYNGGTGDFSRKKKDTFCWYMKYCESNGEDLD